MFGFPKITRPEDFHYKSNFLKSVIFQVKYDRQYDVCGKKEDIKKLVGRRFKNFKDIITGEVQFSFQDKTPILDSKSSSVEGIEFQSERKLEVLGVTEEAITLTIIGAGYVNFSGVQDLIESCINELLKLIGIKDINRLAIRKINTIEVIPKQEMRKYDVMKEIYNKVLIDGISYFPAINQLEHHFNNNTFISKPYQLNLNYGALRSDSSKWSFLLDIDLFRLERGLESNNILEEFVLINNEVFNIFNWCLLESIKESLNEKE